MKDGPGTCLLAVLATGLLLAMPVSARSRAVVALLDLGHAPTFGVLAMVVARGGRAWLPRGPLRRRLVAWALVVLFGGAMELVQGLVGRSPSWSDAAANALGAGAFLAWASAPGGASRARRLAWIAAGAALLAIPCATPILTLADVGLQAWEMPRLASFEHHRELSRWDFQGCRVGRSAAHATDGLWSLRLEMGPALYPAATLTWPPRDWSGHDALTLDAYLGPGPPLDLVVKVEDLRHNHRYEDRFERVVRLRPGAQRVRIELSDVARAPAGRGLDLRRVGRLQFFAVQLRASRAVYLDDIRLR